MNNKKKNNGDSASTGWFSVSLFGLNWKLDVLHGFVESEKREHRPRDKPIPRSKSKNRWLIQGRGPPPSPPYFWTKLRPEGPKKVWGRPGPPLSKGLVDPPPPHCSSRRFLLSSLLLCQWRPLDSRTRTTTSTRFDWKFFRLKWKK